MYFHRHIFGNFPYKKFKIIVVAEMTDNSFTKIHKAGAVKISSIEKLA